MNPKIKKLQEYLKESQSDAFLVLTKINRQYLCGFTGSQGYLLVLPSAVSLFVDGRYTLRAKKETDISVKNLEHLQTTLKKLKIKTIAIEDQISLREFNALKKQLPKIKLKTTSNTVENLRATKSRFEIAQIERGSKLIDQCFTYLKKLVARRSAFSESTIAAEIIRFGKVRNAEPAFEPIVAFGKNAASPHHLPLKDKIGSPRFGGEAGKNNFLLLDFGFKANGYHSDFTRTLFLGKPKPIHYKIYKTALTAQTKAIESVQANIQANRIDSAARDVIAKAGFNKYFTHNTGHGVGLEIHELPNFSPKSKDILKNNMVVTVEPGIYLPNKFGVRIEDMILIDQNKPKIFSQIPKDFKSMIVN